MAAERPRSGATDPSTGAWLAELSRRLPRHAHVLERLLNGCRRDPRVVQLSIGCSVARGVADDMSDLDCELSLEPEAWPAGLDLVEPLVRSAGDVVALVHHRWEGAGSVEHRRTAAIFEDGVRLDLMVWPASAWSGMHPPDTVVLFSKRAIFTEPWDPARGFATAEQVHEWEFVGWWALLDADKYLRRGSLWEARERLEEARAAVWRLAAAAQRLPFPQYGITTLLDAPHAELPSAMETTAVRLDAGEMRSALARCAALLAAECERAASGSGGDAEATDGSTLARWALARLGVIPGDDGEEAPTQRRPPA